MNTCVPCNGQSKKCPSFDYSLIGTAKKLDEENGVLPRNIVFILFSSF